MSGSAHEAQAAEANGSATPGASASVRRIRFSTTMALIMAILGSSLLPVSYAFATTGILFGFIISVVRTISCSHWLTG